MSKFQILSQRAFALSRFSKQYAFIDSLIHRSCRSIALSPNPTPPHLNPTHDSPIKGVMAEVKTELLCTTKVIPAPTRIAKYPASQPKGLGKSEWGKKEEDEEEVMEEVVELSHVSMKY